MFFSLLSPNLKSPNVEDAMVGSANEVMSDNHFASTAKSIRTRIPHTDIMFIKMVALTDRCSSFCLFRNCF